VHSTESVSDWNIWPLLSAGRLRHAADELAAALPTREALGSPAATQGSRRPCRGCS
jgi:hypothetical protein